MTILYQDQDLLAVDKPAGIAVFREGTITERTLMDELAEQFPELAKVGQAPRHGVVHRLDKDTSGVILVAKTQECLIFLQKQFKNREVQKKYLALATGTFTEDQGKIHTLIGRSPQDPRKQKVYDLSETGAGRREALTEYRVVERFTDYTLLELEIKTGRKHQIRAHLAFMHHPVAGDKKYSFKDSPTPQGLPRQFLHASYLKITLPNGEQTIFQSPLPPDLQQIITTLEHEHTR